MYYLINLLFLLFILEFRCNKTQINTRRRSLVENWRNASKNDRITRTIVRRFNHLVE